MHRWTALAGLALVLAGCGSSKTEGEAQNKAAAAAAPTDWPTFRGANRDGLAPDKGLLKSWPKDGPPLAWKEPAKGLGKGYSSVAVVGSKVFTLGDVGDSCFVFALDRAAGAKLWEAKVGASGSAGGYEGPRCTPTIDGDRLYALTLQGRLVCLDVAGGKEIWSKDLGRDFGGKVGGWGWSESVLIDGEKVLCTPGGKEATIVALEKTSGNVIWAATRSAPPKSTTTAS
jgi:glucose dehydrogenase